MRVVVVLAVALAACGGGSDTMRERAEVETCAVAAGAPCDGEKFDAAVDAVVNSCNNADEAGAAMALAEAPGQMVDVMNAVCPEAFD